MSKKDKARKGRKEEKYVSLEEGLKTAKENIAHEAKNTIIKKLGLPGFKKIVSTAENKEEAETIRKWIAEVPAQMEDLVSQFWTCADGDEAHFEVCREEFTAVTKQVTELLNPGIPVAKAAAVDAYSMAMAKKVPAKRWAILAAINGKLRNGEVFTSLSGLGIIAQVKDETPMSDTVIRLLGRTYQVYGKNAKKITSLLSAKAAEAREEAADNYRERVAELLGQTTEAYGFEKLGEEPGKLAFSVPDSSRDSRDGGVILVESDGKDIHIVGAVGHFQRRVTEIMENNRVLRAYTLDWDDFRQPAGMEYEVYKDLRYFWTVVKRGMQSAAQLEEKLKQREEFKTSCEAERKTLAEKATVDSAEWLLKKVPGVTLISMPSAWEVESKTKVRKFWFVSFLAERSKDGKVKLAEFPERLKDLFQNPRLIEPTEPGETCEKLAYPLSAMLKMAYGIAKKRNQTLATETKKSE